jgi:hypothetical protein
MRSGRYRQDVSPSTVFRFLKRFKQLCSPFKSCRSIFESVEAICPDTRVQSFDELKPNCCCQNHSVSKFSSGAVQNEEVLIRILVAPQHTRRGKPRASALTDAERRGLSVLRESKATDQEIFAVAEGLVKRARSNNNDKAGVIGVLRMVCDTVRSCPCHQEGKPCYCVYDSALEDTPSHAEAFQRVAGVTPEVMDKRRQDLFGLVKDQFVPVADFRDGLLTRLAPSE